MGQKQSAGEAPRQITTEELSHELALRFATKCFTHLEIAHFKDNFKTFADHTDDIEYWKEETLTRFLCLPDELQAGNVVHAMSTYLGAFPFPSLAPCILTREAMMKIVTIMTERYSKILKRGKHDRVKLLFRSLAVFDRRMSTIPSEKEKPTMKELVDEQKPEDTIEDDGGLEGVRSHVAGFAIDEPANDDEEEDDDELALAALDALDAIEVFKEDQKIDRKINHAQVPVDHLKKLIMLLLHIAPLGPQESLALYSEGLSKERVRALGEAADSIIAAFEPDQISNGVRYPALTKAISASLPYLFDPLNPLFEHFLFSKNIDLSKHRDSPASVPAPLPIKPSPIVTSGSDKQPTGILTPASLTHLSTFLSVTSASSTPTPNLFHVNARFHHLYSTTTHGTSLSSFSRQIMSWQAPSLLLISGSTSTSPRPVVFGAFLPKPWDKFSTTSSSDPSAPKPTLFQLSPRHAVFPANPYNKTTPISHFSSQTGIALGCIIPPASRTHASSHLPILGPVSLRIDSDISTAIIQHDADEGLGAFLPDAGLENAQRTNPTGAGHSPKKFEFEIDTLEVWGVDASADDEGDDAATKQKKKLAWDEAEAARRRGVNFGGDKDGARALLEMAGLVGDHAGTGRSGGSV